MAVCGNQGFAQVHQEAFKEKSGESLADRRVREYMKNKTKDHVEILDPTSRLPVPPSQAMVAPTWAFGSGSACPDVIEKVQARHACEILPPVTALVPRQLRDTCKSLEDMPAHENRVRHLDDDEQVIAQPEFQGTWEEQAGSNTSIEHISKLSKFEQKVRFRWLLRAKSLNTN
jgi:hypothetical protein